MSGNVLKHSATIANQRGLHARAAAKFAQMASEFEAEISVSRCGQTVSARSIMGLMMLGAAIGCDIELVVQGSDAEQAMLAAVKLIEGKFGEN